LTAAPNLFPQPVADAWISGDQVLRLTKWTDRWLRKQVQLQAVVARDSKAITSNGRPAKEYLLSSLPADAQAKHLGPALQLVTKGYSLASSPLFAGVEQAAPSDRTQLTEAEDIAQADQRYAILKPLIDFRADPARFASIVLADRKPINSEARMIDWLAAQKGVSAKTLKRYKARYLAGGWAALADRTRSDNGTSRWFNRYPNAAMIAAYVYLEQRQSATVAWEAIKRDKDTLGIPDNDLPSYETVRAALQSVTPALRILAREGATKYRELCAPYISRGYTEYANQITVSDHCILDVEVMNDVFPHEPWGMPMRMQLTCLLDFRSRFVVGLSWCRVGSSRSIGTAMRRAISTYGPPESFYCDNGKDYLKVAKGAIPTYLRDAGLSPAKWHEQELHELDKLGLMARLDIAVTHCIVRHPQSKHVERFFRTMHERFDKRWPTYTGGNPSRRPDLTEAAMASHRKLMRHGKVEQSRHPRASMFIACFEAWLEEYHNAPHSGRGMDGRTPAEVFEQERNPNQKPAPEPHVLAMMLAERESRVVQEGSVELAKRRYVGYDAESYDRLHRRNRTQVIVAYDPNDPEAVAILDQDGVFLTWARAEQYTAQSNSISGAAIADSMQVRRHLEKQDRQTLRGITLAARQIGARSEVEHLAERAALMPSIDHNLTHRPFSASAPDVPDTSTRLHSGDIADRLIEQLRSNQ
jgi:putative transposase